MSDKDASPLPSEITELLQKTDVGYVSIVSPKGELYSYPIAFYFSGWDVYFGTPASSAKLKFIRANPKVSLIVDNRKLTQDAVGALLRGKAHVLTIRRVLASVFSMVPTARGFSKKYPGLFSFYAKGKELPDERKLYKYRLVRITPASIMYWIGYKYGRYVPKKREGEHFGLLEPDQRNDESDLEAVAGLLGSGREAPVLPSPLSMDESWVARLDEATSEGSLSREERRIIRSFLSRSSESSAELVNAHFGAKVTAEEKSILKKWRASSETQE
jgi:general stress protein 26